jgi:enamine deaminase RidA (YjgF/YER057c/UK114 family)
MKAIVPTVFPWKDHTKYTYPLGLDIGGVAFLSGNSASEFDAAAGKIVVKGDLESQIETALAKIRAVLEADNLTLGDIVSIVQYVAPAAFNAIPSLRGILASRGLTGAVGHVVPVNRLMRREALIELEVVAANASQRNIVSQTPHAVGIFESESFVLFDESVGSLPGEGSSIESELRRVERLLLDLGLDWTNVARCRLMAATATAAHLDDAVSLVRDRDRDLPIMPTIGLSQLPEGSAKISLEIGVPSPNAASARAWEGALVRQHGKFILATGLVSRDSELNLVEQVEQIYGVIVPELLASAGMAMEHIVQTVEWVKQAALPDYRQTGVTRRMLLREPFPVASGLVCSALPGDRKVSVDIIACSA